MKYRRLLCGKLRSARPTSIGITATFYLLAAQHAFACNICLPYPEKTALDFALESETLVLARENPQQPYTYIPVENLKGGYAGNISLLVDSTTKRLLDAHPNNRVVLAKSAEEWRYLGYASDEYERVLREAISNRGFEAEQQVLQRAKFFVPYLQSSDRQLSQLARLEVARAPYSVIRTLDRTVPREEIYSLLRNIAYGEWHSLYILMLGISDQPEDITFIRRRLEAAAKFDVSRDLAAYLTAYIEMLGEQGVSFARREFLANGAHDKSSIIEVLKALSIHGREGRTELRAQVIAAYHELLVHHSDLAGHVARDLIDWEETRFANVMARILESTELDEPSQLAVRAYLRFCDFGPVDVIQVWRN